MGGEGTRKTLLLVQCLGPEQCHLGVIFTLRNAENRLSAPRIDARSMPPTQNVIQDAMTGWGELSKKEGIGRDGLPGGRHLRLGLGQLDPLTSLLFRALASWQRLWGNTKSGAVPHLPISQSLTFFFSLEEGSLPEQRPGSTPLAPFARVVDLARLLSTSSSSNFFLLMNLWRVLPSEHSLPPLQYPLTHTQPPKLSRVSAGC